MKVDQGKEYAPESGSTIRYRAGCNGISIACHNTSSPSKTSAAHRSESGADKNVQVQFGASTGPLSNSLSQIVELPPVAQPGRTYGPPHPQAACQSGLDQSASTYPC